MTKEAHMLKAETTENTESKLTTAQMRFFWHDLP